MSELVAYLLGELDPAEAAAFERAMAADAKLRAEVERLRPVVTRLERLPAEAWEAAEPPPLALPADSGAGSAARRAAAAAAHPSPLVAAACAVVLLAAGIGLGVWLDRDPSPSEQLALQPVGDVDPAACGKVSLASDGVNVRVSASSRPATASSTSSGCSVPTSGSSASARSAWTPTAPPP